MNLFKHPTKFGDVWITNEASDLSNIEELYVRDAYRVQALKADGFDPDLVYDVGCNRGLFTHLAATLWPQARIIAFEPQLEFLRAAMANMPDNALPVCLPVLGFPDAPFDEVHADQQEWRGGRYLPARVLGELSNGFKTVLLKLDVEGAEVNILRELEWLVQIPSGEPLLRRFDVITGEWHHGLAKEWVEKILSITHNLQMTTDGETGHFFARVK